MEQNIERDNTDVETEYLGYSLYVQISIFIILFLVPLVLYLKENYLVVPVTRATAPTVILISKPYEMREYGDNVILKARVTSGIPCSSVKWLFIEDNNRVILKQFGPVRIPFDGIDMTYEIDSVKFEDAGEYRLYVQNSKGYVISYPIQLAVKIEPAKAIIFGRTSVQHGEQISIASTVYSKHPLLSLRWIHARPSCPRHLRFSVLKTVLHPPLRQNTHYSTLEQGFANSSHYGIYHLEVLSSNGFLTISNPLMVNIKRAPPKVDIYGNDSVQFRGRCTITGGFISKHRILSIKWQKRQEGVFKDINISNSKYLDSSCGTDGPKLVIDDVNIEDATDYRLKVSNAAGSGFSEMLALDVMNAPPKVKICKSIVCSYKDKVKLTACVSSNQNLLSVNWQKVHDSSITNLDVSIMKYHGSSNKYNIYVLVINQVDMNDACEYQLRVCNSAGVAVSKRIKLTVLNAPPYITICGRDTVSYNESTRFGAKIKSQSNILSLKWYQKDHNVVSEVNGQATKYFGTTYNEHEPKLVINSTDGTDDGISYWLETSNISGISKSTVVKLTVRNVPPVVSIYGPSTVEYADDVILIAKVSSDAHISRTKWQKTDNKGVKEIDIRNLKYRGSSEKFSDGYTKLVINKAELTDEATYELCTSYNRTRITSNQYCLHIQDAPPVVIINPTKSIQSLPSGGNLTITAVIESSSEITFVKWWRRRGHQNEEINIKHEKYFGSTIDPLKLKLVINNLDNYDHNVYIWAEAKNEYRRGTSDRIMLHISDLQRRRLVTDAFSQKNDKSAVTSTIQQEELNPQHAAMIEANQQAIRRLEEENKNLTEQKLCKVCLDHEMDTVFVPCGHICCCNVCAGSLNSCPICRLNFSSTVKAYFS